MSREVTANGDRGRYRAHYSDRQAWSRATRPKACKLATNPALRATVEEKLRRRWSPQQIAGCLKLSYPNDSELQVWHESIHRTLYVQSRGAPCRELTAYLRSGRVIRRPRGSAFPMAAVDARASCTSPSGHPRPRTARFPVTGKATWSSVST